MAQPTSKGAVGPPARPNPVDAAVDAERRHRERVNLAFRIGRHFKRVHKIVDPRAQEYYDDDGGDHDSGDDDYDEHSDYDNEGDHDEDDQEDDISSPQDGDEPYEPHDDSQPEQQREGHDQAVNDHHTERAHDSSTATDITRAVTQGASKSTQPAIKFVPENAAPGTLPTQQVARAANASSPTNYPTGTSPSLGAEHAVARASVPQPTGSAKTSAGQTIPTPIQTSVTNTTTSNNSSNILSKAGPTPSTSASTPARPKPDPLGPTAAAPYGFKVVKVRMPDGQVVQKKRPKTAEDAAKDATKDGAPVAATNQAAVTKTPVPPNAESIKRSQEAPALPIQPVVTNPAIQQLDEKMPQVQSTVAPTESTSDRVDSKGLARASEKEIISKDTPPSSKSTPAAARTATVIQYFSWVIMILFSLVFLGLGIATAASNNHAIRNGRDSLQQAVKVAISLWPIVFAAIVAQTLKAYGAWKVERGIRLVTLEQLNSSHSVGAAVKQPFLLRQFNVAAIGLLVIWLLSPLASQALVRMVSVKLVDMNYESTVEYLQLQQFPFQNTVFDFRGNETYAGDASLRDTIYTSLLIGNPQIRAGATDAWGNPKIPVYNTSSKGAFKRGWTINYSSLIGVPMAAENLELSTLYNENLDNVPGWSFTTTTPYFVLNCTDIVNLNLSDPKTPNYNWTTPKDRSLFFSVPSDDTQTYQQLGAHATNFTYQAPGPSGTIYWGSRDTGYLTRLLRNSTDNTATTDDSELIWFSQCSYQQQMVNTTMVCLGSSQLADVTCTPNAQHIVPATDVNFKPLGLNFASVMLSVGGANSSGYSDTEKYIYNPDYATLTPSETTDFGLNYDDGFDGFQGEKLATNLGQLVNTLWMVGHEPSLYLGGDFALATNDSGNQTWIPGRAQGKSTGLLYEAYQVKWAWVVVLIMCSVLLLVAAVAAAMFESRTVGPDFLGFANTAIRKGVKLPPHMGALSARERLQAMQECEILLQDVRPGSDVGKIALGVKDEKSVKLVHGREYR